jgi:hypothetical protein
MQINVSLGRTNEEGVDWLGKLSDKKVVSLQFEKGQS